MSSINCAIAETITSYNLCFILNVLEHIGFNTNDIRTYDINIIVHKTSKDNMLRTISYYHNNMYQGFTECLKIHNKKCVIYVIVNINVSDNVEINCVLNVSIIIINNIVIHAHIVYIV